MSLREALLVGLVASLGTGCLRAAWVRESRYSPLPQGALERLEPGEAGLAECLQALGAPLWVWEQAQDGHASAALAWGWFDESDLGFNASVPLYRSIAASFEFHDVDQRMKGAVLFFDAEWRLRGWRKGLLRDLTRDIRRPTPQLVEEDP